MGWSTPNAWTATEIVTALPVPLVDPTDIAAPVLSATVLSQPVQTLDSLRAARHGSLERELDITESVELPLMEVRAPLDLGDVAKANRKLEDLAARVGWRWRLVWFKAVSELLTGDFDSAKKHFNEVLDTFPANWRRSWRWPPPPNSPDPLMNGRSIRPCGTPTTTSSRPDSAWPGPSRWRATATARSPPSTKSQLPQGIPSPRG